MKGPSFFDKQNVFENEIIFIDGLWGCGKSLIGPVIAGMEMVEKPIISTIFENISILLNHNKIAIDAADALFKTYLDEYTYHSQLGRNINLRMYDDSGVLNNPNPFKDFIKLFKKDINVESDKFKQTIIPIMGHMVLISSDRILKLKQKKIKFIEVVRHPVYVFEHWHSFLNRFSDKKILNLAMYNKNYKMPWFAESWKEEYFNSNSYDRTLLSIIFCYKLLFKMIEEHRTEENLFIVSFESIVYDSKKSLSDISKFIGRNHGPTLKKTLKDQQIPRLSINSGKGHSKYGWNSGYYNDELDFKFKMKIIRDNCSVKNIKMFLEMTDIYNKKFPSNLKNY